MLPEKLPNLTQTPAQAKLEALKHIAPECFIETCDPNGTTRLQIDFEALREALGDAIAQQNDERYEFSWIGKQKAKREADEPIYKTLRPCPEQSLDWDTTQHLYIEGDNLEVLKLLQRAYLGKVKMIYIDPPYNTGNEYVYRDSFKTDRETYQRHADQIKQKARRIRKNHTPQFHSHWCSMIYSRLLLARTLLADDGVIFISIDDNEIHNLRKICEEIFGGGERGGGLLAEIVWERAYAPVNLKKHFSTAHDFILCYAKNPNLAQSNGLPRTVQANRRYANPDNDPRGPWKPSDLSVGPPIPANIYTITTPTGRLVEPPPGRSWRLSQKAFEKKRNDGRIWFGPNGNAVPSMKRFLSELKKKGLTPTTIWKHTDVGHSQSATQALAKLFDGQKFFDYPKPVDLIKRCVSLYTDSSDIILDFFSGSATTAHAVMQLNAEDGGSRRYICVQLPEPTPPNSPARKAGYCTISDIGKERIRRASKQIREAAENQGKQLDIGFRVLRVDSPSLSQAHTHPAQQEKTLGDDRSELDLLFGAMLSAGVPLSLPIRQETINGQRLHIVDGGTLVACFANTIAPSTIQRIASIHPSRIVLQGEAFTSDDVKINLLGQFKQTCGWSDSQAYQRIHLI